MDDSTSRVYLVHRAKDKGGLVTNAPFSLFAPREQKGGGAARRLRHAPSRVSSGGASWTLQPGVSVFRPTGKVGAWHSLKLAGAFARMERSWLAVQVSTFRLFFLTLTGGQGVRRRVPAESVGEPGRGREICKGPHWGREYPGTAYAHYGVSE